MDDPENIIWSSILEPCDLCPSNYEPHKEYLRMHPPLDGEIVGYAIPPSRNCEYCKREFDVD